VRPQVFTVKPPVGTIELLQIFGGVMAIGTQQDEWRERVEDGELIRISAEDKHAATILAARMDELMAGQPILHAQLAVQILATSTIEGIAGKEWAKALDDVFKQIPIED
jgi:hypothetical protein